MGLRGGGNRLCVWLAGCMGRGKVEGRDGAGLRHRGLQLTTPPCVPPDHL
jgi:hypothetical protein